MKKLFENTKIFLTLVLVIASAFMISTSYTHAAAQTIQAADAEDIGVNIAGIKIAIKQTTDGTMLYCLERPKKNTMNTTLTLKGERDAGIAYIMANGYPNKSITGDKGKDYYITQAAVWWYLDDTTGSSYLSNEFKNTAADANNLRPSIKELVNNAKTAKAAGYAKVTLDVDADSLSLTKDGDYYVSSLIKVATNADKYTVSLSGATANTKIVGANTKTESATLNSSEGFIIKVPASEVVEENALNIQANVTSSITVYKAYEYAPQNTAMQVVTTSKLEPVEDKATASISVTKAPEEKPTPVPEKENTTINITKIASETGNPLAGAVLVIKDANGNVVERFTTTTETHVVKDLPYGSYTLSEESAPSGYYKSDEVININLNKDNNVYTIRYANYQSIEVPNTSTSSILFTLLGLVIIGSGLTFVVRNGKKA